MSSSPPNLRAHQLLDSFLAEPNGAQFAALVLWLLDASPNTHGAEVPRTRRLALLGEVLRNHPRQADLIERLRALWISGNPTRLLAEAGLPAHITLLKESFERLVDRFVPRLERENDLYVLLTTLGLTEQDALWFEQLPPDAVGPWSNLLALPAPLLIEAARLVAIRVGSAGVARELLELEPNARPDNSPFLKLTGGTEQLITDLHDDGNWAGWLTVQTECHQTVARAHDLLETRGISTDLIYRLELIESGLLRLEELLAVAAGRGNGREFAGELIRASIRQRGIRSLARTALKRLSRKVVEHTGESGDHYVVRNQAEWKATGRSAAGGGVLTAFTALGKYALGGLPLAPLVAGLGLSLNYTLSFVAMQLMHFTLASKQPAMTAAALAASLENQNDVEEQVELVAGITRSQVMATIGNVLITIPVCLVLILLWRWARGEPLLTLGTAHHTVDGTHPIFSFTIPFAALTGVFLWMSSLAAGWAANWSGYRGLPQALARHPRLIAVFGRTRAEEIGQFVEHNLSGIVGYTALGFLLGFMPVAFRFAGLPIEVRHVTLQTASLTLASASLYLQDPSTFHFSAVVWGFVGILVIGVFNFGISFALALRTAMRARDLGRAERARLWAAIRHAFKAEPRRFLWKPRR
jgi:site-specific recombinase